MAISNLKQYDLKDGETIIVKGKVAWGDVGHKTAPKNSKFQQDKKWSLSLIDPEVVKSTTDAGKQFVEQEMFVEGKGNNQGHMMLFASSKAPNAPLIFDGKSKARTGLPADEVLMDNRGQIRSIQSGTPVEIALQKFTSKQWGNPSIGLQSILVQDINNIPFFQSGMTIEGYGIKAEADVPPFTAKSTTPAESENDAPTSTPASDPAPAANDDPFDSASISSDDDPFV